MKTSPHLLAAVEKAAAAAADKFDEIYDRFLSLDDGVNEGADDEIDDGTAQYLEGVLEARAEDAPLPDDFPSELIPLLDEYVPLWRQFEDAQQRLEEARESQQRRPEEEPQQQLSFEWEAAS
jgi:hypothetical protein